MPIAGTSVASTGKVGGVTQVGTTFNKIVSGKPNAPIQHPVVSMPNRPDYGAPTGTPTIGAPDRGDYGKPSRAGIPEAAKAAHDALGMVKNPTGSEYFKSLMGQADATLSQAESSANFEAKDAAQKSGFGNADSARMAQQDKMSALAMSEFAGGKAAAEFGADVYGKAESAFVGLQTSFNQAKQAGDTAYAQDLAKTHLANAENFLNTAQLNMNQQLAFAHDLNEAKGLQAKLDQDFNNSLIDNNRYIEQSQQIAAQLAMQQAALKQHAYEFDVGVKQHKEDQAFAAHQHELDLLANPGTAIPVREELRPRGPLGKSVGFGTS